MAWIPMMLRGTKVLVRCSEQGEPSAEGGRVEIRYKAQDSKAYRAGVRNLAPIPGAEVLDDSHCVEGEAVPEKAPKKKAGAKSSSSKTSAKPPVHPEEAVIVYADGACSGNPGPAGSGVVIVDGDERAEFSEYLGNGTNNIAELTAILRAAERLADRSDDIHIYTDSRYSIGVLTQGWKAKKNPELIAKVKAALDKLPHVQLHYVPGHAGVELNERADELARAAVTARASAGWVRA